MWNAVAATLWASSISTMAVQEPRLAYEIQVEINPGARELTAAARLRMERLGGSTKVLLDATGAGRTESGVWAMQIHDVTVDGESIVWKGDPEHRQLLQRRDPERRDDVEVTVSYKVALDDSIRATLGYDAFFATGSGTHWYPQLSTPDGHSPRFHDFQVELAHPPEFTVLTSGTLQSVVEDDPLVVATYSADRIEGFALNFGPGLDRLSRQQDEVRVLALTPPPLRDVFQSASAFTAEAIDWYTSTYDFFPSPQIAIAPGHPEFVGGFPSSNLYYLHLGDTSEGFLTEITAHEVGHYYWGHYVLADSERRLDWLQLANGIWADQLYLAETRGYELDRQWREGPWFRRYVEGVVADYEQELGISAEHEQSLDYDYNTFVRHAKGAVGVFLQARRIGVERFLDVQRGLLEDHAHQPLSVDEFAERLEEAGADGAREFFRAWQCADASLDFDAELLSSRRVGEQYRHHLTVTRRGTVPYPIELLVRDVEGNEAEVSVDPTLRVHRSEVTTPAKLEEVVLDPHGVIPARCSTHPRIVELFRAAAGPR